MVVMVVTEPLDIVDVIVTGVGVADELAAGALALALLGTVALEVGAGEPELVPGAYRLNVSASVMVRL
jgi:hypothetical protein